MTALVLCDYRSAIVSEGLKDDAYFYDRLYSGLCGDIRRALVRAWTYSTLIMKIDRLIRGRDSVLVALEASFRPSPIAQNIELYNLAYRLAWH